MKKVLLVMLVLALTIPAFAIDKNGLLEAGIRLFYWMPQGNFGEAYDASLGFGAKVGYGVSSNFEIVGEAWYGLADFNENYWGLDYWDYEEATPYLTQFSAGARVNFSPYSQFDPYAQLTAGYYMWAMYKEVGVDTDGDGDVDEYQYQLVEDDSTRKFGINARLGGEFFTSKTMSIDVGVGWNSIFSVEVPEPVDVDGDGFYDAGEWNYVEETVNTLTFSAGANFYF
jgi:hypothetical protein